MKNKLKQIIIALFAIIIFFFLINIILYMFISKDEKFNIKKAIYRKNSSIEDYAKIYKFRIPHGENDKPYNIVLFGCAYTEGLGLNDNQTLSAKLSEHTKKKVYNRGVGGGGIQHALIQIKSHYLDSIIINSKYVIYLQSNQYDFDRLYYYPGNYFDANFLFDEKIYPKFVKKNNQYVLYKSKIPIIEGSILYRLINKFILTKKYELFDIKNKNYLYPIELLIELKEEINKINPNTKFILLLYWDKKDIFKKSDLELLNKNKIKIIEIPNYIDTEELDKLANEYEKHPSENAWIRIVPILVNILNII